MEPFPHSYQVVATADSTEPVQLTSDGLSELVSMPPSEFGGPGGFWSPETLLVAAIADCYVLGFRAIAVASKLDWLSLQCSAQGTLDRVDRVTRFTAIKLDVQLTVPEDTSEKLTQRVLEKAESSCLITNSLNADVSLRTSIVFDQQVSG